MIGDACREFDATYIKINSRLIEKTVGAILGI